MFNYHKFLISIATLSVFLLGGCETFSDVFGSAQVEIVDPIFPANNNTNKNFTDKYSVNRRHYPSENNTYISEIREEQQINNGRNTYYHQKVNDQFGSETTPTPDKRNRDTWFDVSSADNNEVKINQRELAEEAKAKSHHRSLEQQIIGNIGRDKQGNGSYSKTTPQDNFAKHNTNAELLDLSHKDKHDLSMPNETLGMATNSNITDEFLQQQNNIDLAYNHDLDDEQILKDVTDGTMSLPVSIATNQPDKLYIALQHKTTPD
ncbi:MAG: hypothetical protein AAF153_03365, partial [Pseudomonadota bacterium]